MNIFRREKWDMEEGFIKEREDIRRKLEVEFCRILQQQRLKFKSEIQGYDSSTTSLFAIQKRTAGKVLFLRNANIEIKIRPREARN